MQSEESMIFPAPQMDVLHHLYESQRLYTTELARVNEGLEKLYKKLAKIDAKRDSKDSKATPRSERRKLKWSSTVTTQSITNLEAQRTQLFVLLQQCRDTIFAYSNDPYSTPATPWTTYLPPSPFRLPFLSPWPISPWSAGPYRPYPMDEQISSSYYQDAVESQDVSESTDWASDPALQDGSSADGNSRPEHVFSHEFMLPAFDNSVDQAVPSNGSSASVEHDIVPHLKRSLLSAIDTDKANQLHTRRKSENILAVRSKLKPSRVAPRGVSAAPVSRSKTAPALIQ